MSAQLHGCGKMRETENEKMGRNAVHAFCVLVWIGGDNSLSVVDCGWRQRQTWEEWGRTKGKSFHYPPDLITPSPKTQPEASEQPVDYYNLNQSFKATTGMLATTRFFVLTGVPGSGSNLVHIHGSANLRLCTGVVSRIHTSLKWYHWICCYRLCREHGWTPPSYIQQCERRRRLTEHQAHLCSLPDMRQTPALELLPSHRLHSRHEFLAVLVIDSKRLTSFSKLM